MNIKLILQYDGTAYHGWQIQPECPTIQGIMEKALSMLTNEQVDLIGCGRTDAGVHACDYVCNFHTSSNIPPDKYALALNTMLPSDIVCKESIAVSDEFHSKKSIKSKTYQYVIDNSPIADAFEYKYSWLVKPKLDIYKMQKASKYFIGTHDFIGFAATGFSVKTTIRTLYDCSVSQDGNLIKITVCGNGFLYNMVRIIVGTLVGVGIGKIEADTIAEIIEAKDRRQAGKTAPPEGLFLLSTEY